MFHVISVLSAELFHSEYPFHLSRLFNLLQIFQYFISTVANAKEYREEISRCLRLESLEFFELKFAQFLFSHVNDSHARACVFCKAHINILPLFLRRATCVINRTQIYASNAAQYTCTVFILMLVVANNASRLNKCMRVRSSSLQNVYARERAGGTHREMKREQAIRPCAATTELLYLSPSSPGSSFIPEIGQKSNRVAERERECRRCRSWPTRNPTNL